MTTEITIARPLVFAHAGTVYANSQPVAEFFERRHDNVLSSIRDLLSEQEINPDWFTSTTYVDEGGRTYPAYNMTRDGFTLLAMGFTGSKALHFKVRYINSFNAMERTLSRQTPVPMPATKPKLSGSLVRETRKLLDFAEANWCLSPASQQAFAASLFKQVGIDLPEPVVAEKHYTTSELAARFDLSPNKFGRLVKHLKTPDNGEYRLTTSMHSGKQVEVFVWNQRGADAVAALLDDTLALADDTVVPFEVGDRR